MQYFIRQFPKFLSASMLAGALWFGICLSPAMTSLSMDVVYLPPLNSAKVDPNLYLLKENQYTRIGRVHSSSYETRISILSTDAKCDCVMVLARPSLRQFLSMQEMKDLKKIGMELSRGIASAFTKNEGILSNSNMSYELRALFVEALNVSLQEEKFRQSQSALADYIGQEINPKVMAELTFIFKSRLLEAMAIVLADASENYGLDFLKGHFSTLPLTEAVDSFIFDPRVISLFGDVITNILDDKNITQLAKALTDQYVQNVIFTLAASDYPAEVDLQSGAIDAFRDILDLGHDLVSHGGTTHPVILGVVRNEFLPHTVRSDGILIIMERARAVSWFPPSTIYEFEQGVVG